MTDRTARLKLPLLCAIASIPCVHRPRVSSHERASAPHDNLSPRTRQLAPKLFTPDEFQRAFWKTRIESRPLQIPMQSRPGRAIVARSELGRVDDECREGEEEESGNV